MVSDKFKERFIKLKKEDADADIRITKRYIDDKDTVQDIAHFISTYNFEGIPENDPDFPLATNKAINEVNGYKSIVIEFEVTKTTIIIDEKEFTNYPYKLTYIFDYNESGTIDKFYQGNKGYERFDEGNDVYDDVRFNNEIKFKSIVTTVTVLKSRHWYEKK